VKTLDVLGTGVKAAAKAIASAVRPAAPAKPSREAVEELRRRGVVNAAAAESRARMEQEIFGSSRWLGRRPGWLSRGR
jgi:hypothetical protein